MECSPGACDGLALDLRAFSLTGDLLGLAESVAVVSSCWFAWRSKQRSRMYQSCQNGLIVLTDTSSGQGSVLYMLYMQMYGGEVGVVLGREARLAVLRSPPAGVPDVDHSWPIKTLDAGNLHEQHVSRLELAV